MRRVTLFPVLLATALSVGTGFVVTVLLPAADTANTTRTAATRQYTKGEVAGRGIYASEGCIYCHTQQVRDTFTDAGLASRPTRAGDSLNDAPGLFGTARFGPDLSCVGDRVPGAPAGADDEAALDAMIEYLEHPAEVHHGSTMPSYSYLSSTELRRLASYLVSLRCDTEGGNRTAEAAE